VGSALSMDFSSNDTYIEGAVHWKEFTVLSVDVEGKFSSTRASEVFGC
jgi:hypothetical protein